ncbi:MAG TPA: 1,4-alpha-glucan branching protein GlgB [Nannocystis exedens]|nr:1,4-alpha-glucan branching protein GlgB [Nannocystis exedens]
MSRRAKAKRRSKKARRSALAQTATPQATDMGTKRRVEQPRAASKEPSSADPSGQERPQATLSCLRDVDVFLFHEGTHLRLYEHFGSHLSRDPGRRGASFAVWAPNAVAVAVIGDFNDWNEDRHVLRRREGSGIWELFVEQARAGQLYKYRILTQSGERLDKADPMAAGQEHPPGTASVIVAEPDYHWHDEDWIRERSGRQGRDQPISIYEVHLGSWMRIPEEGDRWLSYREIAPRLADYVADLGFTHVELMPLAEHPFYGSWGYQTTGYFAPTARYGDAEGLMFLVDTLHQRGIGVIIDWVPAHFPSDAHGLCRFDGTHLYEHEDPRRGYHPDWKTLIFNYGRHEVRSFLLSSAMLWLDRFHVDGLRVDAVASMLYLDYSRAEGEWLANVHGGRENLEAIDLLQRLNQVAAEHFPGTLVIAEESTAWPKVSRPVAEGGLGFSMKWDMGWMHDTLRYFGRDPLFRRHHHREINFRMMYAYSEDFVLPLSHDEVVHGKGSLVGKMQGERSQRLAHLALLYGYMFASPGKKLLFMGCEFAQEREWNHDRSLDWHLLEGEDHGPGRMQAWVAALNRLYVNEPGLHQLDHDPAGFRWIDADDAERSIVSFLRLPRAGEGAPILVVLNCTPVARPGLEIGASAAGSWTEVLRSDLPEFGGTAKLRVLEAETLPWRRFPATLRVDLPALGVVFLRGSGR